MQEFLPREKLIAKGVEVLTDVDLVAAMISTGAKGKGVKWTSQKVVREIQNEAEKGGKINLKGLSEIDGMGKVKAVKILAGIELGKRLYGGYNDKKKVVTSQSAYELVRSIASKKQEYLVCIYLNARYELIAKRTIGIGTLNKLEIVPRDIIIPGLLLNAAALIMSHNHPSQDALPSKEDIDMTARVKQACDLVGLMLLDHIVVTLRGWRSIDISGPVC